MGELGILLSMFIDLYKEIIEKYYDYCLHALMVLENSICIAPLLHFLFFFSFPTPSKRVAIAEKLTLTPKQVKDWFAKECRTTPEDQLSRNPLLKATLRLFASSHGEHGLPEELENLRPTYDWCLPFDENTFDTLGGRKLRDVEVELIRQMMLFSTGNTIIVAIIGTNSIRKGIIH